MVYRHDGHVKAAKHKDPSGKGVFEILANGNQFVAFAIHPDTKRPYAWGDRSPLDTRPDELPAVSQRQIDDFVKRAAAIVPLGKSTRAAGKSGPIPEGGRNDTLTRVAGKLRGNGWDYPELLAELLRVNHERCSPPLAESEVETIAGSAMNWAPNEPLTDLTLAKRLAAECGDLRHCNGYWRWDGSRWIQDKDGGANAVKRFVQELEAKVEASGGDAKAARVFQSAAKIAGIERLLRSEDAIQADPASFDTDPWLLNVKNGTIDLKTGRKRDARRADMITKTASVEFDEGAKCLRWDRFLREVFHEDDAVIDYVQRVLGYALTGVTQEEEFQVWVGSGRNGKSTLVETFLSLLGDYAKTCPPSVFIQKKFEGIGNDIADLVGTRMAVASETERNQKFAVGLVKRMTGGDTIKCRQLYKEYFSFKPQAKFLLLTNGLPTLEGYDPAFIARLRIVRFKRTFTPQDIDRTLKQTLLAELPGILNWAIRGCLAWQREGLNPPATVLEEVASYRDASDKVGLFLADRCEVGDGLSSNARETHSAYAAWLNEQGFDFVTAECFGSDMRQRGHPKSKTNGRMVFRGVTLATGGGGRR